MPFGRPRLPGGGRADRPALHREPHRYRATWPRPTTPAPRLNVPWSARREEPKLLPAPTRCRRSSSRWPPVAAVLGPAEAVGGCTTAAEVRTPARSLPGRAGPTRIDAATAPRHRHHRPARHRPGGRRCRMLVPAWALASCPAFSGPAGSCSPTAPPAFLHEEVWFHPRHLSNGRRSRPTPASTRWRARRSRSPKAAARHAGDRIEACASPNDTCAISRLHPMSAAQEPCCAGRTAAAVAAVPYLRRVDLADLQRQVEPKKPRRRRPWKAKPTPRASSSTSHRLRRPQDASRRATARRSSTSITTHPGR